MLDDFVPLIHNLAGRTIKVWPIADVHIGSKECEMDAFQAFLKDVNKDKDAYIVLCGDIINNGVKDSLTNVYEETMPPSAQIDKAVELLRPLSHNGKILGAVGGNHEARSRKAVDLDPMYTIMCMLRIPHLYRQNMAFVRLNLKNNGVQDTYNLLLTHGKSENKGKQFSRSIEGIDCYIQGHTHRGVATKPSKIVFSQKGVVSVKPIINLVGVSWLKFGGYASAAQYLPNATSDPQCLELEFTNSNNRQGRMRVIW